MKCLGMFLVTVGVQDCCDGAVRVSLGNVAGEEAVGDEDILGKTYRNSRGIVTIKNNIRDILHVS